MGREVLQKVLPLFGLFGAGISPKHNRSWYCIHFQWKANGHPALTALLPSHGQQHPAVLPAASSAAVLWEDPIQQQEQQCSSLGMRKHFWRAYQKFCRLSEKETKCNFFLPLLEGFSPSTPSLTASSRCCSALLKISFQSSDLGCCPGRQHFRVPLHLSFLIKAWLASVNTVPQLSPSPPLCSCSLGPLCWSLCIGRGRGGGPCSTCATRGIRWQPRKPLGMGRTLEVPLNSSEQPND